MGSDEVYENVMELIETYRRAEAARHKDTVVEQLKEQLEEAAKKDDLSPEDQDSQSSPRGVIPPFYPQGGINNNAASAGRMRRRRRTKVTQRDTWDPIALGSAALEIEEGEKSLDGVGMEDISCVRDLVTGVFLEVGQDPPMLSPSSDDEGDEGDTSDIHRKYLTVETFVRIT